MCRVRVLSALGSSFLLFCASSCARMQASRSDVDLLATGLVGWQQIGGQPGAWRLADGVLSVEGKEGGWLATSRSYENFGLSLEFRVSPGADSGVYLRAPLAGDPACAGLEIQIADNYARRSSPREPWQYTGSIYGVQAPSDQAGREAGRWQKMVIIAEGPRIRVGLNGKKIVDTDLTYYAHLADTHPGLARTAGYIGLQSDGSLVEFRNVTIRELPQVSQGSTPALGDDCPGSQPRAAVLPGDKHGDREWKFQFGSSQLEVLQLESSNLELQTDTGRSL